VKSKKTGSEGTATNKADARDPKHVNHRDANHSDDDDHFKGVDSHQGHHDGKKAE
jgi:hypothetical protein